MQFYVRRHQFSKDYEILGQFVTHCRRIFPVSLCISINSMVTHMMSCWSSLMWIGGHTDTVDLDNDPHFTIYMYDTLVKSIMVH